MIDYKELTKIAKENRQRNVDINLNIINENIEEINLIIKEILLLSIESDFKNRADFGDNNFLSTTHINNIIKLFNDRGINILSWDYKEIKKKIIEVLKNNLEKENILVFRDGDNISFKGKICNKSFYVAD
jgi:hypothetical protein